MNRSKMCVRKVSFTNKAKARKIADKFDQRIYECPICFCWHTTAKEKWQDEFVRVEDHIVALKQQESKIREELNEKNRKLSNEVFELHKRIKEKKKTNSSKGSIMSDQEQINEILERRLARIEKYLQYEGHEITKYDGLPPLPEKPE